MMNPYERLFVLWAVSCTVGYSVVLAIALDSNSAASIEALIPFHFLFLGLNLVVLVLIVRDLYRRDFATANQNLTWGLLILGTGGVGALLYLYFHGLRPRSADPAPMKATTGETPKPSGS